MAFACHHAVKALGVSLKIDCKMTSSSQVMALAEAPVIYTPCTHSLLQEPRPILSLQGAKDAGSEGTAALSKSI